MKQFENFAALLAANNGNLLAFLNDTCLLRTLQDNTILAVPDSFRGRLELPKGIDITFVTSCPTGASFGANDFVRADIANGLVQNTPQVGFKAWRFGSKAASSQKLYLPDATLVALTIETNGQTMVFDDDMKPVTVTVVDLNDQIDLLIVSSMLQEEQPVNTGANI